jgi:chromosomal replication initiation ATPase DnaA
MSAPERQPETRPTWEEVREALRETLNRREETTFTRWFEPVTGSVEDGERGTLTLRMVAPSHFHADWIKKDYLPVVEMVWRQFAPEGRVFIDAKPKAETKTKALQPQPKGEVAQLRLKLPDDTRPFSNVLARCALFSVVSDRERKHFADWQKMETFGEVEVWLKGDQFCQEDHDSLAQMMYMANHSR